MRAAAIDNKQRVRRPRREISLDDAGMREIHRAGNMCGYETLRGAHVEQNEFARARDQVHVNIPAVGFKREEILVMIESGFRVRRGDLGNA
jgi:hypothetical protein